MRSSLSSVHAGGPLGFCEGDLPGAVMSSLSLGRCGVWAGEALLAVAQEGLLKWLYEGASERLAIRDCVEL